MAKIFLFSLLVMVSSVFCQVNEVQPTETNSLENFVYLWKELQTPKGLEWFMKQMQDDVTKKAACVSVWEGLTGLEYFSNDLSTDENKDFVLKLCNGYLQQINNEIFVLIQFLINEMNYFDKTILSALVEMRKQSEVFENMQKNEL